MEGITKRLVVEVKTGSMGDGRDGEKGEYV
jgi:hypothetical protein